MAGEPITAYVHSIEAANVGTSWGSDVQRFSMERVVVKWGWNEELTFTAPAGTHRIGDTITITHSTEGP